MYEIGLVPTTSLPAVQIIGPYLNSDDACEATEEYNKDGKIPGHSWMWARWGEMPRAEGCLVSEPTK